MESIKQPRYAVVFPGQGSQYVGMGQELALQHPAAREVFDLAESITEMPLMEISFLGPEDVLQETANTQPCLLATSIACYNVFREKFSQPPAYLAGHSAGEYAALVAGGVLSFENAIRLIQMRGHLMSQMQGGSMAALKSVPPEEVEALCRDAVQAGGVLVPANYNSPDQIVISGDVDSIEEAILSALDRDLKVVPLSVSGAFHSPLMKEAAQQLSPLIQESEFQSASIPVVANATANAETDGDEWKLLLEKQITAPVLWEQTVRYLHQQGITTFVEIGPGKVLSRLINKIIAEALTYQIHDESSLEATIQALHQQLEMLSV